jgi:lysylphosphatidylglycerol synthetase-like protein (DUF2156 family)
MMNQAAASKPFADFNFQPFVDHPSGFLALSPRNQRFTVDGVAGLIAYRERGRHLIAFGGVHAPAAAQCVLLDRFLRYAQSRRLRAMFVQVRAAQTALFVERGFTVNQFGTSYGLELRRFSLRGSARMQLRNKLSRARKAGLRIVEAGRDALCDEATFRKLRAVSSQWLRGKGKELDFMIGELGGADETWRRIFMALDANGAIAGFITYVPAWGETPGYLHDLTRRLPTAPPGTMELCNAHAIERMTAEGVAFLHFGFTPFITGGAELPGASRIASWAVRQLRKRASFIYPAESQAQYKLKWGPEIVEREYIAARPLSMRGILDLMLLTRSL